MSMKQSKHTLPPWLKRPLQGLRARLFDIYAVKSYSQEGEDRILQRMFEHKGHGFYVDVGAHHPRRFSNTYLFYRRGWSGINIEPNPDVADAFRRERKRDINLQMGISDHQGSLAYYLFSDPALNSFNRELATSRVANSRWRALGTKEIPVHRLDSVLRQHLPPDVKIDFMSVDVEGMDMVVLQSNDWDLFRPTCVLVESISTSLEKAEQEEIFLFMKTRGYELFAKTVNTLIFTLRLNNDSLPASSPVS